MPLMPATCGGGGAGEGAGPAGCVSVFFIYLGCGWLPCRWVQLSQGSGKVAAAGMQVQSGAPGVVAGCWVGCWRSHSCLSWR